MEGKVCFVKLVWQVIILSSIEAVTMLFNLTVAQSKKLIVDF